MKGVSTKLKEHSQVGFIWGLSGCTRISGFIRFVFIRFFRFYKFNFTTSLDDLKENRYKILTQKRFFKKNISLLTNYSKENERTQRHQFRVVQYFSVSRFIFHLDETFS